MKIGFITTSRADFGIYLPLIRLVEAHPVFEYLIFVGGMHTSEKFGNFYQRIENNYGFQIAEKLVSLVDDDTPNGIVQSMSNTTAAFGKIWRKYQDELTLTFALGDRFEMFAAVASTIPFNIKLAHIHGGETTLGAIDNKFRHALTVMCDYHFTSHEKHAERVQQMVGTPEKVYNVGAMGIDSAISIELMSTAAFYEKFQFDITKPYFLTTYHPETVNLQNDKFIAELLAAFKILKTRVLCTLPNADTQGNIVRNAFLQFEKKHPNLIKCFENLGSKGYLTAMKHCEMIIGNTSGGIIESGAFQKPALNIGNRQKGRVAGKNIFHVSNETKAIIEGYKQAQSMNLSNFVNPYGTGDTAEKILNILEEAFLK